VAVAPPLISTVARPELDIGDPPIIRISTPEQAAALAREQLGYDPDFIKFWFIHDEGDDLSAQKQLLHAVALETHAAGKRLVVHATQLEVAKAALEAGADILAHSVSDREVDQEFLELARQRKALYVTTLFAGAGYRLALSATWQPTEEEQRLADPEVLAALGELPELISDPEEPGSVLGSAAAMANVRMVWDAGISMAIGSDAGNIGTLHGPGFFREVRFAARAGLSPREILQAATVNGAKVMGLDAQVGRVEAKMIANLVILESDPLVSVEHLTHIHSVVRAGRVYEQKELVLPR
jgi:imidazolonepropionase-like amidohydrolase